MNIVVNFTKKYTKWKFYVFPTIMIEGLFKIYADKNKEPIVFPCCSGGWGRRPIDAIKWEIISIETGNHLGKMFQGLKRKWYFRMKNIGISDQTGILGHPDANPKGTKGCIGFDIGVDEKVYQTILNLLKIYKKIPVSVSHNYK